MPSDLKRCLDELANGPLISARKLVRTDLHGYTQARLAEALGMSQEEYAEMRHKAGNPLVPKYRRSRKI